jgi:hypothetical protein
MTQQHSEHHGGVLKAFNGGSFLATVQLTGSLTTWLQSVPVSRAIAAADMVVGRKVAVLFFDPTNPADAVVTAVYT